MRSLTGVALAAIAASLAWSSPARGDGEVTARGMYYKERSTRVVQPMIDATFDVGERGSAEAHFLVDAITSASAAAGPGGDGFSERRYEAGGTYRRRLGELTLGGTVGYSTEPDYKSGFGALHADLDLLDKNLTVSATFGASHDTIEPLGAQEHHSLTTLVGSLSVSQVLSEHGLLGVSYDLMRADGYQANPYRRVQIVGTDMLRPETHPELRARHALAATLKWFFPSLEATVIGQYRFYTDDWDQHAHTPELRIVKDLGEWMTVGVRYRYHRQDAAGFFQDAYHAPQAYLSADEKLSAFDSHLVGARFELTGGALHVVGVLEEARVELVGEYIVQHNDFGNAFVSYAALVLPLEY